MTAPQSNTPDLATTSRARRSTRILEPVRLKIFGESRVGTPQVELTSAVTVNCHGCLYLSRHEHRPGSWIILEISNQHTGAKSAPVRAKVTFVGLPRNPRELYRVGVELEKPANIWGIEPVPEDWHFSYSNSAGTAARAAGPAPAIQTATPTDREKRIPPDSNELEASAHSLTSVASHVNTAVKDTTKAIEIANQESILKIADGWRRCDTLMIPARVGFLDRLNSELANAGEHLFERATALIKMTQTVSKGLDFENAAEVEPAPMEAATFSKKLMSGQVNVRAGRDVRYSIKIDTSEMLEPTVTGWFRASGGAKNDIALVIATEYELENLIHGREARVIFATDSITTGEFHVSITQSGSYILALINRFSIFMPRIFTADIDLRYSAPRQSSSASEAPDGCFPKTGRDERR